MTTPSLRSRRFHFPSPAVFLALFFASAPLVGCGPAPTCSDGVLNGTESDIDCGGQVCGPCAPKGTCLLDRDCASFVCAGGQCTSPTCTDKVQNGSEADVDCGGKACAPCKDGASCQGHGDCVSRNCEPAAGPAATTPKKQCVAATCTDGVSDGLETDVDCGGGTCGPCMDGQKCQKGSDCLSISCASLVCAAPSCIDKAKNGLETDLDCGGGSCPGCAASLKCLVNTDCQSQICTMGICAQPSCTDLVKNGNETDIDCGGACGSCVDGQGCAMGADCLSGSCAAGVCAKASCTDMVKNGTESDIDCGGTCKGCDVGKACNGGNDCASGVCHGNRCSMPAVDLTGLAWTTSASALGSVLSATRGKTGMEDLVYSLTNTPAVHSSQSFTFTATAPKTVLLGYDWNYSAFHAWYMAQATVSVFADGMNGRVTTKIYDHMGGGQFGGAGAGMVQLTQGMSFGFIVTGQNFDTDETLTGTLSVQGN